MRICLMIVLGLASAGLQAATLQVVNAIPQVDATSAPTLSVFVDGAPLVTQLRYAELASLAAAPSGMHTYSIRAGERTLAESQISLNGAAPNGHMLALAGDGLAQPFKLVTWQIPNAPASSISPAIGTNYVNHTQIVLAPRWDTVSYGQDVCWHPLSTLFQRSPVLEQPLAFGSPLLPTGSGGGTRLQTCQLNARSPTKGLLSLRLPELSPGPHVLTHFLIGNGTATTPFEWLTVDNGRILARGHGSYATGPVIAGPRFLADPVSPGSGLFLGADSTSSRIFGFLIGQGSDHRSTWTLIDGPRVSPNKFKLASYGGTANTGEEYFLTFQSCTDARLERRVNGSAVSTRNLRRGIVPKSCDEYRPP